MVSRVLDERVQDEIVRLAKVRQVDARLLEEFAHFVIVSFEQKPKLASKSLKVDELKQAVYNRFGVKTTRDLEKSGAFNMATDGMDKLDFRQKSKHNNYQ